MPHQKKKKDNEIASDAVSVICARTGIGRSVAESMFAKLSSSQRAMITPSSQESQIRQILGSPQPEPAKKDK